MTDLEITREDDEGKGRYVARLPGIAGEGEITFTRPEDRVISANHTGVPESMEGKGVAKALLHFMLEDARSEGFRIVPICPSSSANMKTPEWSSCSPPSPAKSRRSGKRIAKVSSRGRTRSVAPDGSSKTGIGHFASASRDHPKSLG